MEFELGYEGKHFLMANDNLELSTYLPTLKVNLGEENVKWSLKADEDGYDFDDEEDFDEDEVDDEFYQYNGYPYTYAYHSYPEELILKHPEVLAIMQKKENVLSIPEEELNEILALPKKDVAKDLENIIFFFLGKIGDGESNLKEGCGEYSAPVAHACILLREVGNCTTSLDAVLEVVRQSEEIQSALIGDAAAQILIPSLIKLGKDNLLLLESTLHEVGITTRTKIDVLDALAAIPYHYPEKNSRCWTFSRSLVREPWQIRQRPLYQLLCQWSLCLYVDPSASKGFLAVGSFALQG